MTVLGGGIGFPLPTIWSGMNPTTEPSVDELIEQLDPARDYGDRRYDEVVADVRAGDLIILPGKVSPVLKDAYSGKTVKGTGKPIAGAEADKRRELQSKFIEKAADDFDSVYKALLEAILLEGDVRAMKIWIETAIGKPGEMRPAGTGDIMERIVEAMMNNQQIVREVIIEQRD